MRYILLCVLVPLLAGCDLAPAPTPTPIPANTPTPAPNTITLTGAGSKNTDPFSLDAGSFHVEWSAQGGADPCPAHWQLPARLGLNGVDAYTSKAARYG